MSDQYKEDELLPYIKLQFNVSNPPLEDCYLEGYEAAHLEQAEGSNPYELTTMESQYWLDGWWAGFYGEEPCLDLFAKDKQENVVAANDEFFDEKEQADFVKKHVTMLRK